MSLILSECNQEILTSFNGMFDNLTEQDRERRLVELLADILRKRAISKIDDLQNTDGRQQQDKSKLKRVE